MSTPPVPTEGIPAYLSRDLLREWRESCGGESVFHETRILALIDALEAPCGSCHPCSHWAAETWRRAGGELPHKHVVDEWREKAEACTCEPAPAAPESQPGEAS